MTIEFSLNQAAPEPIYLQIKEQLKRHIQSRQLAPHTLLPSINQLTRATGVSMRTVDLALNQLIQEGICYRRPKKGTFVAAPGATPTVSKRLCGLYVAEAEKERFAQDSFDTAMYHSMMTAARSGGMDIILLSGALESDIAFYSHRTDMTLQSIILLETRGLDAIRTLAEKHTGIRWICANYRYDGFEDTPDHVIGVFNDDFGGAHRIAGHYFDRGCRAPAVISLELPDTNYRRRVEGFRTAAREHGIPLPDDRVTFVDLPQIHNQFAIGAEQARRLLAAPMPPDIIFCTNDYLARGASDYLAQSGLSAQVRVTGYDRLDFGQPQNFSTVAIDFNAIGSRAFALALDRKPTAKIHTVYPELIIRGES